LKHEIKNLQETIPLIEDLMHESMRDRHWNDLRIELKDEFRETEKDFNLEKIMSLELLAHAERITDVCEKAKKQLDIEVSLQNIKHTWE
jgi:dynein heavy chain, axonemal